MTTITLQTVVLASEITDRDIFDRVVSAYKKAGFNTDEHCTNYPNRFSRPHFGMGNFALGWLDANMRDRTVVVTVAELLGGAV